MGLQSSRNYLRLTTCASLRRTRSSLQACSTRGSRRRRNRGCRKWPEPLITQVLTGQTASIFIFGQRARRHSRAGLKHTCFQAGIASAAEEDWVSFQQPTSSPMEIALARPFTGRERAFLAGPALSHSQASMNIGPSMAERDWSVAHGRVR